MAPPNPNVPLQTSDVQNFNLLVIRLLDDKYPPSVEICNMLPVELIANMKKAVMLNDYNYTLLLEIINALNDRVIAAASPLPISAFEVAALIDEKDVTADNMNRRLLAEAYPVSIQVEYSRETQPDEWFKYYVAKYTMIHQRYKRYAERLEKDLNAVCRDVAPLAIVQSREKSIISFAEKIWRKKSYTNPLGQMTDLCGVRIITETNDENERIIAYLKRAFTIDYANSEDTRNRLAYTAFGYNAVHYIIQIKLANLDDPLLFGLKGEAQVKTLLQHAWSSISHDRIYKPSFNVPERIKRNIHRVAALLEECDNSFSKAVKELDEYKSHYGSYMTKEEIVKEIKAQDTLLKLSSQHIDEVAVRLKIAHLYKISGQWEEVTKSLLPLLPLDNPLDTLKPDKPLDILKSINPQVLVEMGHALCRSCKEEPEGTEYKIGTRILEWVNNLPDQANKAHICSYLAWTYSNSAIHGDIDSFKKARDMYREAYELDNTDPYALADYLSFEVYCRRNRTELPHYMRFTINEAIEHCEAHIRAGIELPWAYFTIGRLNVLLNKHYQALNAYCKGIAHCLFQDCDLPPDSLQKTQYREILQDERNFLKNINIAINFSEEDRWVDSLLLLAIWLRTKDNDVFKEIAKQKKHNFSNDTQIIIVAGGTDEKYDALMQLYNKYLADALTNFQGCIISGATTSGIPGLIADIVHKINGNTTPPPIKLFGYIPSHLPANALLAREYEIFETTGSEFSPRQPIQAWIDLIASNVDPKNVVLMGINGGDIAAFEYQSALALGAKVGLFAESGRAVETISQDPDWIEKKNLLMIPRDPMIAWALVHSGDHTGSRLYGTEVDDIKKIAESIHNRYLLKNRENQIRKSLPQYMSWDKLEDVYIVSNISQANYMSVILRLNKYHIQKVADGRDPINPEIPDTDAWKMAEMEHGRYVIERILAGWRYGAERDNEKKLHPCLVPWDLLTEQYKKYDFDAVKKWPVVLAEAKFDLIKE